MLASMRCLALIGCSGAVGALIACGPDLGSGSRDGDPLAPKGGASGKGGKGGAEASLGENYFENELKPGNNNTGGKGSSPPVLGEGVCKQQDFNLSQLPPEMIIVFDRSGSMQRDADNGRGVPTRWTETAGALDQVINTTQAQVYWGLQLYPTCTAGNGLECLPTPCTVQGGSLAPAPDQHQALKRLIDAAAPRIDTGATPTAEAIKVATAELQKRPSENPKFILLATDGQPNCKNFPAGQSTGGGEDDVPGAIAAVKAAADAAIPVFVVGIATEGRPAHDALNQMATAGGRAQDGAVKYYSANNRDQLVAAITSIAGQVQDCTFQLSSPPPSPTDVAVDIDDTRLAMSDWSYGAGNRSIVVTGMWCEKLKTQKAMKAQIIFGCPGVPVL